MQSSDEDAHHENDCGITYQHAFAVLSAFELKDENGESAHKMVMVRNPRNLHFYDGKWNTKDTYSWTRHFIDQVPFGINPLSEEYPGLFFIESHRIK